MRPGTWTSGAFWTLDRMNSPNTPNNIFSPVSEDGPLLFALPDGPTANPLEPGHAPASRSAKRGRDSRKKTSATCGPRSATSSRSERLQLRLGNRLRAKLDVNGSPEYALTWKLWDMESGPRICALRASGRRTSDNAFTGWPTTRATDGSKGVRTCEGAYREANRRTSGHDLCTVAMLSGWPTPDAQAMNLTGSLETHLARVDALREKNGNNGAGPPLGIVARLTGWRTPNALPESRGGLQTDPEKALERIASGHQVNLDDQACLAGWVTPQARDGKGVSQNYSNPDKPKDDCLPDQVQQLAGWHTPHCPRAHDRFSIHRLCHPERS